MFNLSNVLTFWRSCVSYIVVLMLNFYTYVVKCFNLVSMLLCLIHSRVNAEPISFVAPEKYKWENFMIILSKLYNITIRVRHLAIEPSSTHRQPVFGSCHLFSNVLLIRAVSRKGYASPLAKLHNCVGLLKSSLFAYVIYLCHPWHTQWWQIIVVIPLHCLLKEQTNTSKQGCHWHLWMTITCTGLRAYGGGAILGEKFSLFWLSSPCFKLREKFECMEHIGKS